MIDMKTELGILTIVGAVCMTFVITSCKKEEVATQAATTSITTTTPTTLLAYNFKAKLDGKEYNYTHGTAIIANRYVLNISSSFASNELKSIFINLLVDSIKVGKNYVFSEAQAGSGKVSAWYVDYGPNGKKYKTEIASETTGKLTITKYDLAGKKISGNFYFTAYDINDATSKVEITEGSFTDLTLDDKPIGCF